MARYYKTGVAASNPTETSKTNQVYYSGDNKEWQATFDKYGGEENFKADFIAMIKIKTAGIYKFITKADDSLKTQIDEKQIGWVTYE